MSEQSVQNLSQMLWNEKKVKINRPNFWQVMYVIRTCSAK